jgi:hypothetical protein
MLAALALVCCRPAAAAPGLYGMTSLSLTELRPKDMQTGVPVAAPGERILGLRIGIGYETDDPRFAYECTLASPGRVEAAGGGSSAAWSIRAYGCSALYQPPMDDSTSWLLKGGAQRVSLDLTTTSNLLAESDWAPSLALGIKTDLSQVVGWRFEYERLFNVGREKTTGTFAVDTLLLSLYYKFK